MQTLNILTPGQINAVLEIHEHILSLLSKSGLQVYGEGGHGFRAAREAVNVPGKETAAKRKPKGYTLSKIPSKKHGFTWYVRYQDKGETIPSRWSTGTADPGAANRFAVENRDRLLSAYHAKEPQKTGLYPALKNFYKPGSAYLAAVRSRGRQLSDHTSKTYHNFIIKKLLPFLRRRGVKEFADITPPLVLKLQNHLLKGNKPQTVNYFIGAVKAAFDYLVMEGTIPENVFSKTTSLTIPQKQKLVRGCYNVDEIRGVFNRRWPDPFACLLCLMIYTTGLRNSEIGRIRDRDITKINGAGFVNIPESKTGNGVRLVPLHPFVRERLRRHIAKKGVYPGGYIFFQNGRNNESTVYSRANMIMGSLVKKITPEQAAAELDRLGITFYSGRHYWKTLMNAEKLGDVEEFFMGHKVSSDVAKRYNHRDRQGKAMLAKKAGEVFRVLDRRLFKAGRRP
jgi:integrase